MGIARRWVFPIIRMLIFLVIAVTLVKLAFFSGAVVSADAAMPSARLTTPLVAVATGTVTNDVTVSASVAADVAAPVKATLAGDVKRVLATAGQAVDATTPVLTIHSETTDADGNTVEKTITVTAGAAGTISALTVIPGQLVSVGDVIGHVAPPTFSISGSLTAAERYRLLTLPTEGQVTITGGPAPFTCTGLTLASTADASTSQDSQSASTPTTTVHCAVPAGVTVFAGLTGTLTIASGVAKDVLVVPLTAVEGSAGKGIVFVKRAGGATVQVPVTLGLSDGSMIQITGGLALGQRILEFVPGAKSVSGGSAPGVSVSGDPDVGDQVTVG